MYFTFFNVLRIKLKLISFSQTHFRKWGITSGFIISKNVTGWDIVLLETSCVAQEVKNSPLFV